MNEKIRALVELLIVDARAVSLTFEEGGDGMEAEKDLQKTKKALLEEIAKSDTPERNRLKVMADRLHMCLGAYLDYCACDVLYKCYDPHDAMREYAKYKKEVQDE